MYNYIHYVLTGDKDNQTLITQMKFSFLKKSLILTGPSGRQLVEIQQMSGAVIQISKKGTFAPGTRNRIVTISGQQNSITMAHYLIEQKIQEEESKRARQNPVTGIIQ